MIPFPFRERAGVRVKIPFLKRPTMRGGLPRNPSEEAFLAMDTSPSGRAHPRGMLGGDARGWKMNPRKKKAPFSSNIGRVFCELRVQEPVSGSSWRIKGKATFRKQLVDTKGK